MKLLVLGGTRFLGRAIVESALARGHDVTLFHRGHTGRDVFPGIERLLGDRAHDLSALAGRRWEAAIDTCGYLPRIVARSTTALSDAVEHYTFVSTISVYADSAISGLDESAARARLADPAVEEVTGETYGPLKALCEDVVNDAFPGRALIARPGLIVGPHDPTGRFTYWVERVAAGGEVLAPGDPDSAIQWIDVRDLAEWMVGAAERAASGTCHLTGPASRLTMGAFLEACRAALGSDARFRWAPEEFLLAHGVVPWAEMPLWVPAGDRGFLELDLSRALASGLAFRPPERTIRDTLTWAASHSPGTSRASVAPLEGEKAPGLDVRREQELLAALEASSVVPAPAGEPIAQAEHGSSAGLRATRSARCRT